MSTQAVWDGVDRLIDGARSPHDLRAHGLHLLAARRWRELGLDVPPRLVEAERDASFIALATPLVLGEIRAAYDGAILVVKGAEIATRYPDVALRPYGDIDVIVDNADAAFEALLDAGFTTDAAPQREGFHHRPRLRSPRFPVPVEVHCRPSWLVGGVAPPFAELLEAAGTARVEVDGILAPAASHHAVLAAAHSWSHEPLARISQLLDATLLLHECDRDEASALASRWGVAKVWQITVETADALFLARRERPALRRPLRRLRRVEERTVVESHIYRALGPFWALPPLRALGSAAVMLSEAARPEPGEGWRAKSARIWQAFRHARMGRSQHERRIGFRR